MHREMEMNSRDGILVAGVRWHLAHDAGDALSPAVFDLDAHLNNGIAQVVKHGPARTVYRIEFNGTTIYWKHCRISGVRSWLRQCLRPPKARMEFERALELKNHGIPTIEPLAWGTRKGEYAGESFLITKELANAASLQTLLFEQFSSASGGNQSTRRRRLSKLLGRFMAQLHEVGIAHPDLHPGNILVVNDENECPRFHLIDLHSVRMGMPLSWTHSSENLVIFNRWFVLRSSRADRLRFWRSYFTARKWHDALFEQRAREVECATIRSNLRFWATRDRRCLGTNRYFQRVGSRSAHGHASRELDANVLQQLLNDPDEPFKRADKRILKHSRTSTVAEIVVPTPLESKVMIYKRFQVKKPLTAVLNQLRRSPALRSWCFGNGLRERALPTPRPWLLLHRRGFLGAREGYILYEKVENACDLRAWLEKIRDRPLRDSRRLIAQLARLIRHLHDANIAHRDLKAENLLIVDSESTSEPPSIHFIDLVGLSSHLYLSFGRRAKNLSRLNNSFVLHPRVTRSDKLRFLRTYLVWALRGSGDWKRWWRRVERASERKIVRSRRSRRSSS